MDTKKKKPLSEWKNSYARNNIEAYRKYQREYRRKRLATDPEFRLRCAGHGAKYEETEIPVLPDTMSKEQFASLLAVPVCQICSVTFEKDGDKHMDHDHETGEIRGMLCGKCNVGLGMFQDNIELLESAQTYLKSK
jgi:hypothetical protein